jgi:hypothetical protein
MGGIPRDLFISIADRSFAPCFHIPMYRRGAQLSKSFHHSGKLVHSKLLVNQECCHVPGTPDLSQLIKDLSNSKSEKRSSAARKLRKRRDPAAGPALLEALRNEVTDIRTWKSQFEMILALGELHCQEALTFLWELTKYETPNTIVYTALGDAIVRISSQSQEDVESIFRLINTNNQSLIGGAFHAMSALRLVPTDEQIETILRIAEDPGIGAEDRRYPGDRVGNRLWVAIAAAGWPREKVKPFLERCLTIPDQGLQLAAKDALKGKYTKWSDW